jgi:hypothetical protein
MSNLDQLAEKYEQTRKGYRAYSVQLSPAQWETMDRACHVLHLSKANAGRLAFDLLANALEENDA